MGFFAVIICGIATYRLYNSTLFAFALIITIANLWSFGIMHNYRRNPDLIPDFWASVNMLSSFIGVGLLIYSFFS
ncbi:hypothetical protein [Halothermothrix orenii]|uniref:hypothetical protein n=1 Tax=Halothermothrix orenii TaxID=31909 RepID=UPI0005A1F10B|nr:hypothetical protein [Halothermothrix orenii]